MVGIRNAAEFEDWITAHGYESGLIIARRSVLRTIPLAAHNNANITTIYDWRNKFYSPIFRASVTLSNPSILVTPLDLIKGNINHDLHLALKTLKPTNVGMRQTLEIMATAVYASAVYDGMAISSAAFRTNSIDARDGPYELPDNCTERLNHASQFDIASLERDIDLWSQPLWLEDIPDWAVSGWETLATELTRRAPYWKTLVRWYEDRVRGDDWAASQGRPAIRELEIARASLPDTYWKRGGKAVNLAIAELEAFFWEDKPLQDPALSELVGRLGVITDQSDDRDAGPEILSDVPSDPIPPPALPAQSHGPHFGLRDGLLDFAPPDHLDASRNNIQRLKSLHPLLCTEVASAIDVFGRNMAHGRIHGALQTYAGLLQGEVTALNYDLIAGIGLRLQSEEAAAQSAIADGLEPAFERSETAALKTLLDLHGPFILATEAGQSFVADAEKWARNPRQEKQFREAATTLAEAIGSEAIATPETAVFVKQAADDIGLGPQPERSAVFGVGAIRNVSIALLAGAAIYVGYAVMSMDTTHWLYVLLLNEGIKHSDAGKGTTSLITDAINDVTRGKALKRVQQFVLSHEGAIRRIAGKRREFAFLHEWLDWLKAHSRGIGQ